MNDTHAKCIPLKHENRNQVAALSKRIGSHLDEVRLLRRSSSLTQMAGTPEANVLVIYTGGTIGMTRNAANLLEPKANALIQKIRKHPQMHDEDYAKKRFGEATVAPLVLPYVQGESRRIIYKIVEYDPLLDSSDMSIKDWVHIANDIKDSYEFYDGFLILHGTDTLSYTASALSFMLENLGKTVILTGSQIPIFETRTDGKDNFISGLILSGNYVIPEVCVLFGNKLMRGNRTIKTSAANLDAFDSPNYIPLAKVGIEFQIDYRMIFRPCAVARFGVYSELDENVGLLRIFPNITLATVKAFLQPPMKGVVLQTFGTGNIPTNRNDILSELKRAADNGVIIVNCTQCMTGTISGLYQSGQILYDAGVLPGYDMTPEAALSKLSYVLAKSEWNSETKKLMMETNLRGELTSTKPMKLDEFGLIEAVARSLQITSPKDLSELSDTLFPLIVNTSVLSGDLKKIDMLKNRGADLSAVNHDRRTALHIACCEGNINMVKHLLTHGVSVHIRDRHDRSPLMEAIATDNHDIIKILVKCGAHMTGPPHILGDALCAAASRNSITRLQSYKLADCDLSQSDSTGRTALHVACVHGHKDTIKYLLDCGADMNALDMLQLTPIDYAVKSNHQDVLDMMSNGSAHDLHKTQNGAEH